MKPLDLFPKTQDLSSFQEATRYMSDSDFTVLRGNAVELIENYPAKSFDLIVTDPPYAFGGSGHEHALSASVAITLRECARKLKPGCWMLIMCASSWRSTCYMIESVKGIVEPVRFGMWNKPASRTKTRTPGWAWASVNVIAFRKGPKNAADLEVSADLDYIVEPPVMNGRRAQLPDVVAEWMVKPFAIPGGTCLDPFSGSHAIVKAAARAGMKGVGFEVQET